MFSLCTLFLFTILTCRSVAIEKTKVENVNFDPAQMVAINGGSYEVGTDDPVFVADGEAPLRPVILNQFYM